MDQTRLNHTRKPYTAPKLTEHGRVERLTRMPLKTFGLDDSFVLVNQDGEQQTLRGFS